MSKYVPPHLRVGGGSAAAPASASAPSGAIDAAAAVNNLLRARAAEDAGAPPALDGSSSGAGGSPGGAGQGAWGAWGRGAAVLRTNKPKPQQRSTTLRVVEVDSLVIMKILKHWRDFHPLPVNGQLLGTETRDKLEVTNCFPLPQKKEVLSALQQEKISGDLEERVDEEFDRYQDRMAELMHDLNVDCFTVGWYLTVSFSEALQKEIIESLVAYQELVDRAVLLAFDPQRLSNGRIPFKAYRVKPEFLPLFHAYEADVAQYSKITAADILVEAFFLEWSNRSSLSASSLCWGTPQPSSLERGIGQVSLCLDLLGEEQEKVQRYQRDSLRQQQLQKQLTERRRLENEQRRLKGEPLLPAEPEGLSMRPVEVPSLLPSLLLQAQVGQHVQQISDACGDSLKKMFLLNYASQPQKEATE
ncbi:eukaryotic initiation factor- subunit 3 [Cyclospora cayetanensis]|uniref:Eukaryotic initiation factor-subunit 3 n=1 Tax=Cyclospora cayetanensis TaxID=88456 RepID=A0A1D3D7K9_9EIME|nr:eukaryotic initiation factor- subunit 3 [Cyclospora cayetanensis]